MFGVKMLHQDKSLPCVGGKVTHQIGKCFDAARRSANGHNRGVMLMPAREGDQGFLTLSAPAFTTRSRLHESSSCPSPNRSNRRRWGYRNGTSRRHSRL